MRASLLDSSSARRRGADRVCARRLRPPRCGRRPCSASPTLTPGALNPDVTPGDDRLDDLRHGLDGDRAPADELHLGAQAPRRWRAYGETGPPSAYQEDHLISLELGGNPTDPRNLWPEPYPRAAEVDRIENELNAKVCAGELTLAEAQRRESQLKHDYG